MCGESYTDHTTDDDHPTYFTYTISGKTLTLKESNGAFQYVFEIQSLTSQSLVLFEKGEKDDGEKFEYTYTYKKSDFRRISNRVTDFVKRLIYKTLLQSLSLFYFVYSVNNLIFIEMKRHNILRNMNRYKQPKTE